MEHLSNSLSKMSGSSLYVSCALIFICFSCTLYRGFVSSLLDSSIQTPVHCISIIFSFVDIPRAVQRIVGSGFRGWFFRKWTCQLSAHDRVSIYQTVSVICLLDAKFEVKNISPPISSQIKENYRASQWISWEVKGKIVWHLGLSPQTQLGNVLISSQKYRVLMLLPGLENIPSRFADKVIFQACIVNVTRTHIRKRLRHDTYKFERICGLQKSEMATYYCSDWDETVDNTL